MDEKRFPPTEAKLLRLREQGVLPKSEDVISLGVLVGVIGGIGLIFFKTSRLLDIKQFFGGTLGRPPQDLFAEVLSLLGACLAIGVGAVVVAVFLVGLLQTRFYFSTRMWRFNLSNAFAMSENLVGGFWRRLAIFSGGIVSGIIWLSLSWMAFIEFLGENSSIGRVSREVAIANMGDFVLKLALLGSFAAFAFAGISRIIVVYLYRLEHAMTREEMESELRETETASFTRSQNRLAQDE